MSANPSSDVSFGRYEIVAELGRGSMGVVYQARDPKIDRIVAIKTISLGDQEEDEAEFRERFILEAQAAGRLSHPGIVTVFDVAEDPETHAPYIVMEFVAGQTLKKLLAPGYAKVPLETALRLAQEIAEALAYAHVRGVVHRDIKPANIMITEDEHAKIMDFGVAKLDLSHRTHTGMLMGTPAYMSPEQLTGHSVDGRSDIFSLGVVLYTMLSGHRPFQGSGISTIGFKVVNREPLPLTTMNPTLPVEIDEILARAIAKDVEKRYQTGTEMAAELAKLREQLKNGDEESVSAGLLTVTSSRSSHASGARVQRMQPYTPPVNPTHAPESVMAERTRSKKWYAAAAVIVVLVGSMIGVSWHRKKPLTFAAKPVAVSAKTEPPANTTKPVVSTPAELQLQPATSDDDSISTVSKTSAGVVKSDATLRVDVEHPFNKGKVSLWVDGKLKYSEALHGEAKKKLIVFKKTEGHSYEKIQLPAGKHSIRVRVQSSEQYYDLANSIFVDFPANGTQTLNVRCEEEQVNLSLQ